MQQLPDHRFCQEPREPAGEPTEILFSWLRNNLLRKLLLVFLVLLPTHSWIAPYTRRLHARPFLAGLSSAIPAHTSTSLSQPFHARSTSFITSAIFSSRSFSAVVKTNVPKSVKSSSVGIVKRLAKLVKFKLAGKPEDHEQLLRHVMGMFHSKRPVPRELITTLLDHAIAVQKQLPNVLCVNRTTLTSNTDPAHAVNYISNLTVVGDVHGQYADFAKIFEDSELGGYPSSTNQFIFNGDLVDRGSMALEIVTTLLLAKLLAPSSVHILRGNHETRAMSEHYGFAKEVRGKYDQDLLDQFRQFFDTLPIAAVVEKSVFVVHGGIGPRGVNMTVAEINALDRFSEPDYDSVIAEFLWSGK
jgi:hypothetical protein